MPTKVKLYLDFETRATVDLKKVGLQRYISHPHTQMLCVVLKYKGEEERYEPTPEERSSGQYKTPELLKKWLSDREMASDLGLDERYYVCAHNVMFEYLSMRKFFKIRFNIKPEELDCTMARAAYGNYPSSLLGLSKVFLTDDESKSMTGQANMMFLSSGKDVNGKPVYKERTDSEEINKAFNKTVDYCAQDVVALEAIDKKLKDLPEREHKIWASTLETNLVGVRCDIPTAKAAVKLNEANKTVLCNRMESLTEGKISKPTQTVALRNLINETNPEVKCNSVDAASIEEMEAHPKVKDHTLKLLDIRKQYSNSAASKLTTMLAREKNGRIHDFLNYSGAHTHRWSSYGIQLHNMKRPVTSLDQCEKLFADLKSATSVEDIEMFHGPINKNISQSIRGFIIPGQEHHKLVGVDLSAIEARGLAYLAGEEKVLNIYRTNGDTYVAAYSNASGVPESRVTKDERAVGKVMQLSLGYGGGVDALLGMARGYSVDVRKFMAEKLARDLKGKKMRGTLAYYEAMVGKPRWYMDDKEQKREMRNSVREKIMAYLAKDTKETITDKINYLSTNPNVYEQLTDDLINGLVNDWRDQHPRIVQFWADLYEGMLATWHTGKISRVGDHVAFTRKGKDLFLNLRSGNSMVYHVHSVTSSGIKIVKNYHFSKDNMKVTLGTIGFGGILAENASQFWARDILSEHLLQVKKQLNLNPYLHVHDELIYSVPAVEADATLKNVTRIMSTSPEWAKDVPLAAEGEITNRFWK